MSTGASAGDSTCWTVIQDAAAGVEPARERFARRYLAPVSAALGARWRSHALSGRVDDAVQDVFLDCFRDSGALQRVDRRRGLPFRAFLHGVVRKTALRYEERHARERQRGLGGPEPEPVLQALPADDERLSIAFDRSWAKSLLSRAAARQRIAAARGSESAKARVEILELRFAEGLPIRSIATRLGMPAERAHKLYAKAREEFKRHLREVVGDEHPDGAAPAVDAECARLIELLRS